MAAVILAYCLSSILFVQLGGAMPRSALQLVCDKEGQIYDNGQEWIEDDFKFRCEVFSDGAWEIMVTACMWPRFSKQINIGEKLIHNGWTFKCFFTKEGQVRWEEVHEVSPEDLKLIQNLTLRADGSQLLPDTVNTASPRPIRRNTPPSLFQPGSTFTEGSSVTSDLTTPRFATSSSRTTPSSTSSTISTTTTPTTAIPIAHPSEPNPFVHEEADRNRETETGRVEATEDGDLPALEDEEKSTEFLLVNPAEGDEQQANNLQEDTLIKFPRDFGDQDPAPLRIPDELVDPRPSSSSRAPRTSSTTTTTPTPSTTTYRRSTTTRPSQLLDSTEPSTKTDLSPPTPDAAAKHITSPTGKDTELNTKNATGPGREGSLVRRAPEINADARIKNPYFCVPGTGCAPCPSNVCPGWGDTHSSLEQCQAACQPGESSEGCSHDGKSLVVGQSVIESGYEITCESAGDIVVTACITTDQKLLALSHVEYRNGSLHFCVLLGTNMVMYFSQPFDPAIEVPIEGLEDVAPDNRRNDEGLGGVSDQGLVTTTSVLAQSTISSDMKGLSNNGQRRPPAQGEQELQFVERGLPDSDHETDQSAIEEANPHGNTEVDSNNEQGGGKNKADGRHEQSGRQPVDPIFRASISARVSTSTEEPQTTNVQASGDSSSTRLTKISTATSTTNSKTSTTSPPTTLPDSLATDEDGLSKNPESQTTISPIQELTRDPRTSRSIKDTPQSTTTKTTQEFMIIFNSTSKIPTRNDVAETAAADVIRDVIDDVIEDGKNDTLLVLVAVDKKQPNLVIDLNGEIVNQTGSYNNNSDSTNSTSYELNVIEANNEEANDSTQLFVFREHIEAAETNSTLITNATNFEHNLEEATDLANNSTISISPETASDHSRLSKSNESLAESANLTALEYQIQIDQLNATVDGNSSAFGDNSAYVPTSARLNDDQSEELGHVSETSRPRASAEDQGPQSSNPKVGEEVKQSEEVVVSAAKAAVAA